MTPLLVVAVASGDVLDRVVLDDEDRLAYRTGAGRDIFESRRRALGAETDDAALAEELTGWSNGYIAVRPDDGAGGKQRKG